MSYLIAVKLENFTNHDLITELNMQNNLIRTVNFSCKFFITSFLIIE
jgi:hypothetical protein